MDHGPISKQLAKGLKALQDRIRKSDIASSKLDESINLATWNIREFGKKARSEPAIHYIAEIIAQFDLIGIVELRDDLSDLGRVLAILGPDWNAVYSDAILDQGGNRERIAFVYDKRAVRFNGLAAEPQPPRMKKGSEYLSEKSWWRSPYMASFKSGNFDFVVLSAHVRWANSKQERADELQMLANWAEAKRTEKHHEDKDLIVMGDFNIPSLNDELFRIVTSKGLRIPDALVGKTFGTDLAKDKRYDQILHYSIYPSNFTNAGGILDFYDGSVEPLFSGISKAEFTYQISDHLPLWIQVDTDISGFKLDQIVQGR